MSRASPPPLSIRVRPDYVAAASKFMSNEETQYYLNGVFFEPSPQGGVIVVATDGHAMIVLHDPDGFASRSAIIKFQSNFVSSLKGEIRARKKQNEASQIEIESLEAMPWLNTLKVTPSPDNPADLVIRHVAEIDGRFPRWRKIVPPSRKGEPEELAIIAPRLVRRVADAASLISVPEFDGMKFEKPLYYFFGDTSKDPALITSPAFGEGFAVIMGMSKRPYARSFEWKGAPGFVKESAAGRRSPHRLRHDPAKGLARG